RAEPPLELVVQAHEPKPHLVGGSCSAQRIVLVRDRNTEHRHHRIADELLDGPSMPFDRRTHLVEVPKHQLAHHLGIDTLAHRRRPRHVTEQHARQLAPLKLRKRLRAQQHRRYRTEPGPGSLARTEGKYAPDQAYAVHSRPDSARPAARTPP